MANLKFPYEDGFMTVGVDSVIEVTLPGNNVMTMVTDIPGDGNELNIKLEYANHAPNSADAAKLKAAILKASQQPGSCNIYTLIGDDGTADFKLKKDGGITIAYA